MSRTSPEITHPDYPGERLIACRNPLLAAERARKHQDLVRATENALAPIIARVAAGTPTGADDIGVAVGKVVNKYTMANHVTLAITDTTLAITRKTNQIDTEAALDGIYVLRTSIPADQLDPPGVVTAYTNLAHVERDFSHHQSRRPGPAPHPPPTRRTRPLPRPDPHARRLPPLPPPHNLGTTDLHRPNTPERDNPVAPPRRSHAAAAKASYQHDESGHPYRSFPGLLDHLATHTRNDVTFTGTDPTVPILAEPTADQRHTFDLIATTIPPTLT
jgi:hypothetical protein